MRIVILLLTIGIFLKTFAYGLYQFKQEKNKTAGITILVISTVLLIVPNILIQFRS